MSDVRTVPELIAAQAMAVPSGLALDHGQPMTYETLDRRANRLARRLITLGAGREQVVALLLPRSADLVIAALAAWRAGAAYAPFDPATPPGRLATMLGDAEPCVVVTRGAEGVPPGPWATPEVDPGRDAEREGSAAPAVGPEPSDLACVIYTSGRPGVSRAWRSPTPVCSTSCAGTTPSSR